MSTDQVIGRSRRRRPIPVAQRHRAEQALKTRIRELTALYQFTDQLQRAGSLDDVFGPALDAILGALQCSRASILLRDHSGVMRFVASRGLSDPYRQAVEGHSPWGPEVRDAEPICVDNVADAGFPQSLRCAVTKEGIHALAFIPLQPAGRLIGKFMTYYDTPHAFARAEIDVAVTIARQLGFGIERMRAEQDLKASKDRLQVALDAAQLGWWQYDPLRRLVLWDMRVREMFEVSEEQVDVEEFTKRLHPDDVGRVWAAIEAALDPSDPKPYATHFRFRREKGEVGWMEVHGLVHFEGAGRERRPVSMVGTAQDITERKQREEKEHLLIREINHRAKNMLMVVDAIAHQTATKNPEDFVARFSGRIQALSASQDLLVQTQWQGVDVQDLARAQLAPFAELIGPRIAVNGPKLRLNSAGAQAIGLALHELAINAGRYGALSADSGSVDVRWGTDGETFVMSWTERGGPLPSAPRRRGFGTVVTKRMAERSLGGTVVLDFPPSGLTWRLTCPVANALEHAEREQGPGRADV
jgi:PAS domain S-box-containing protein